MVDDVTKSSCKLSWQPPNKDGGSPVTGYFIEVASGYSTRFKKVNKQPIDALDFEYDLEEGESYEFQVCAVNLAGVGKPSASTGKFTAKDPFTVPSKPGTPEPEVKKDHVALTWSKPETDGGARITGYIVESRRVGEMKWSKISQDGEVPDTMFDAKDLKDGESFEFRVSAVNKAGTGPPSSPSQPCKYGEFK